MTLDVFTKDGYDYVSVDDETRLKWAGVPPRFIPVQWAPERQSLLTGIPDGCPVPPGDLRKQLLWLSRWSRIDEELVVVLQAPQGRGKTSYAAATIRRMALRKPLWIEWPTLVRNVADSWKDGGEGRVLDPVINATFLVIDDFGKEVTGDHDNRMSSWQKRVAFEVINGRYVRMLPTLITTELTPTEMGSRLDRAITSRLIGEGRWIDLSSMPDYRLAEPEQYEQW